MSFLPSPVRHALSPASKTVLTLIALAAVVAAVSAEAGEIAAVIVLVFGNAYAGTVMFRKAQALEERERRAWRFFGLALITSAVGVLAGATYAMIIGSVPAFSGFDFVILAAYVLFMAGLASMPGSGGDWRERYQRLIDGIIVSISVATVAAVLVLEDILMSLVDAPSFDRVVGTAYPLLDTAAVVSVGIVFVRRRQFEFDLRLVLLALGLLIQVVADLSFLSTGTGVSFQDASPNFVAFISAAFFYVAAGSITDRSPAPREVSDRRTPIWSLVAPYGATLVMFTMLAIQVVNRSQEHTDWLFGATFVVVLLVFLRQSLAIRENRLLVERERNSLISSISHELRTPLTSLVGFLSVLDDDGDLLTAGERIDIISTTRQQADYMGRMVTDLVMLARDDLDQIKLTPRADFLTDIVDRSVVSADVPRGNLNIEVRESLLVSVDCDRLQQVLVNLLTNADRYGSGSTTVAAITQGLDLFISVHDNGDGIPKKHQVTMWERFERAHHRYNASVPGSGIGLAIVSSLVKAHGGRVSYRTSELLGGACFTIELPGVVIREIDQPPSRGPHVEKARLRSESARVAE